MRHVIEGPRTGDTLRLEVGDTLEIRLPQRASTGYRWIIESAPTGLAAVEPEAASGASDKPFDRPLPGRTTVSTHLFTATDTGDGTLRFALRRPWETGATAASVTFAVTVS